MDFPLQVEKSGIKWLIVLFRWHDAFSSFNYESPDHKSIWCDMCESSKNGFYYFRVNIHIYSQGWKRKLTLFNGLVFLVLQVRTSHSQTIDSQTRHFWAIISTMFDFFFDPDSRKKKYNFLWDKGPIRFDGPKGQRAQIICKRLFRHCCYYCCWQRNWVDFSHIFVIRKYLVALVVILYMSFYTGSFETYTCI